MVKIGKVITSSFRKDGNSTALAEAFIEEAQKKVTLSNASMLPI